MPVILENFFENNIFRYDSCSCECAEDIVHTAPGQPPLKTYKLQCVPSKSIRFAYAAKKGLVRIAPNGTIEESNILGTLISIPNKKPTFLYDFFNSNGFLFPISAYGYEAVDAGVLFEIINRIKSTVELMTAVSEIKKDYQKILHLTLDLMLSSPVQLQIESMPIPYTTCLHSFSNVIASVSSFALSSDRKQEAFNKDTYTVQDTIYPPTFELDINYYNDIIGGYLTSVYGSNSPLFKSIVQLYCNYPGNQIERKTIDFLFHYQRNVGIINTFDAYNGLTYFSEPNFSNFSATMKESLIEIAKFVLGEEINANLFGIHPVYNADTMAPSWKVDSLLSAIYFSIFYLKPDMELYRPCDNPRCGRYFLVKTTSTKTKFCSTECCNRVTQDRYRKKKEELEQKRRELEQKI
ncbi:CGNR zinc finger domain-containing protein [Clostridium beijerinckii]|uniref:CGNR zinc finger domain-containing protein n=1 Tax=Clostridium beijerinckii TaxID=1520 RepID=UPI000809B9DA|nr:CGNR zinc finger domain-containing protein [Clostridium beijerinckii]OCA97842.1 hypothetical protein BGS1_02105 [Clostridium beijerinckii]